MDDDVRKSDPTPGDSGMERQRRLARLRMEQHTARRHETRMQLDDLVIVLVALAATALIGLFSLASKAVAGG